MSSDDGSALLPSAVTVTPFTVTRPSSMRCSEERREATPACDRIFWRRSILPTTLYHEGTKNTKITKTTHSGRSRIQEDHALRMFTSVRGLRALRCLRDENALA